MTEPHWSAGATITAIPIADDSVHWKDVQPVAPGANVQQQTVSYG